jgi:hypothetical protein
MLVLWMGLWLRPLVWSRGCFSFLLRRDGGDTRAVRRFRANAHLSDDEAVAKMGHPISWLWDAGSKGAAAVVGGLPGLCCSQTLSIGGPRN